MTGSQLGQLGGALCVHSSCAPRTSTLGPGESLLHWTGRLRGESHLLGDTPRAHGDGQCWSTRVWSKARCPVAVYAKEDQPHESCRGTGGCRTDGSRCFSPEHESPSPGPCRSGSPRQEALSVNYPQEPDLAHLQGGGGRELSHNTLSESCHAHNRPTLLPPPPPPPHHPQAREESHHQHHQCQQTQETSNHSPHHLTTFSSCV